MSTRRRAPKKLRNKVAADSPAVTTSEQVCDSRALYEKAAAELANAELEYSRLKAIFDASELRRAEAIKNLARAAEKLEKQRACLAILEGIVKAVVLMTHETTEGEER
jgi:hypothetical protein